MKKSIIAILFIAAIIFGWNWYSKQNIHKPIPLNNVESVVLWGSGIPESHQGRKATKDEVSQIIEWFNSVKDIRVNENFAGATPDAGIRITLKSGEQITIINSGTDFEVQRVTLGGKNISYWAKQRNIRELLKDLGE